MLCKATNKQQSIRIESSSGLSKDEIEKMKMEAEQNAEMDKKMKEDADTFNSADSLLFQVNKSLEDLKDNITEEEKNVLNNKIQKLRESYNHKKVDDVKIFMEEVNQEFQKISEKLYNKAQDTSQNEVTDVDFENVK